MNHDIYTCTVSCKESNKHSNFKKILMQHCSCVNNMTSFNIQIQLVSSDHLYRYLKISDSDSSDSESN